MGRKINRLLIFVVSCSVVGLAVGATASQAELERCLDSPTPTSHCLTEDPLLKKVEGMGIGLLAGAGAAFGATWQLWQNQK
ncbi:MULTISPECIES: hypothetical protein [unclassified Coleofasciculus]|uniref:hypothetical protein n=1 Tax=unclassified Coleofasciculus TaxID=2692782 RepID=UPI0018813468|nr:MULTISPECIES: hypothetical protein [unclassified Coleofasciculus]MBE9126477.1 hypothetical protein [Coleofasciculus sp. LEGE 07081]MBE9148915.1 hypothetical protein [Coleofasciculus sp. LEGE 07092]